MALRKYGWRVAGFVFKGLCAAFILAVVGLLAWRIIDRNTDPKVIKTVTPNQTLCEVYGQYGDKLTLYHQKQNEYTQEPHNYGYFANGGTLFIDEADQLQFVLRYNNSTLKYTAEDYKTYEVTDKDGNVQVFRTYSEAMEAAKQIDLTSPTTYIKELLPTLSREEDVYDVSVLIMYDLTPENEEDNDGKTPEAVRYERFFPTDEPLRHQKTLYNYRKYIFDGIQIDDSVLAVYVDVYYVGDKDYEEDSYGTFLLYYYEDDVLPYRLTGADKKALSEYND